MNNNEKQVTLQDVINAGVKLTPMMEQYASVKKKFPETLIFFRMGDFYEMFFEDAVKASKLLNISLTHRGKLGDFSIPMAGIPHHASSTYIERLTMMNQKIVICEQLEDPKLVKGLVKRGVTQIVTPAIPFDLDKINNKDHRFIASVCLIEKLYFLIFLDFTTGDFLGLKLNSIEEVISEIKLYGPQEFLLGLGQWEEESVLLKTIDEMSILKTHLSSEKFDPKLQADAIEKMIAHYKKDHFLSIEKDFLNPLAAICYYVTSSQTLDSIKHLRPFRIVNTQNNLKASYATLRGLEIIPRDKESYDQSLLGFMDKTKTFMGSRALKDLFQNPIRNEKVLQKRFDLIDILIKNTDLIKEIRNNLNEVWDVDRILCKATTKKINASDTINLAKTTESFFKIEKIISKHAPDFFPSLTSDLKKQLVQLAFEIRDTINEELGASFEKGNLITPGKNKERDRLSHLSQNFSEKLLSMEQNYREETGINNLKIKSNNISGFFIEVSLSHLKKVPKHFDRKQTLVNNERFVTEELVDFEKEINLAQNRLTQVEKQIFLDLVGRVENLSYVFLDIAKRIAQIDVFTSLAWIAHQEGFTRPEISTDKCLRLQSAWHPLIKAHIKDLFVPHNLNLDDKNYFALITGPNMAGKTTVMREVAIIQFLTQIGSFVPAKVAKVSLCDYLFSRLGASDDIVKGQSTFMVEMTETSEILRHASEKSIIILDEIGRGTSTYDGLAIAWSLVEHLIQKVKALTLFSTHYHELIELVDSLQSGLNLTVKTEQKNGKVHFLYDLVSGGATQSFGIHVAELAGIHKNIIERSKLILKQLEEKQEKQKVIETNQLSLFDQAESEIENEIKNIDIAQLTPLEALNKLNVFKEMLS